MFPLHSKSMLGWQEERDTENQWCFGALSSPHWRASMWHITVCLAVTCRTNLLLSVWTAGRRVILLHLQVRNHFENFMKYDTNNDYTLDFNEVGRHEQFTNLCTFCVQLRTAVVQVFGHGVVTKQELLVKIYTLHCHSNFYQYIVGCFGRSQCWLFQFYWVLCLSVVV